MKMHMTKILAAVLLGGTTLTTAAFAQDAAAEGDAVKAVYERYRPDYDAPGIRSGSFLFYPAIQAAGKYNSNIYAQESNVTNDFIAMVKPSFDLTSNWSSDFFSLSAKADIGRYADHAGEDYEDYGFKAQGRKDISHGVDLHGTFAYDRKHEDRGSPDVLGTSTSPTKYSLLTAAAGFKRDVSIVSLSIDGEFTHRNYDNTTKNGGGIINNNDRDRDRYKGDVRIGYELSDGYEAFIRGTVDRVKYKQNVDDNGLTRSSYGYEGVAGAAFDLTGKAKGEVFAGYMKRDYDVNALGNSKLDLPSISGVNYGASLLWDIDGLTSLRGTVSREIGETTVGGLNRNGNPSSAAGVVSSLFSLRAEHELMRNVLFSAEGSYTRQVFKRTVRQDDLYRASLGVKYLLNRNFNVTAGYTYDKRSSSATNSDYDRHSFMVGVTGQW